MHNPRFPVELHKQTLTEPESNLQHPAKCLCWLFCATVNPRHDTHLVPEYLDCPPFSKSIHETFQHQGLIQTQNSKADIPKRGSTNNYGAPAALSKPTVVGLFWLRKSNQWPSAPWPKQLQAMNTWQHGTSRLLCKHSDLWATGDTCFTFSGCF